MKFTVEIDEFWLDEDEDIEQGLKNHIITCVVSDIQKSISKKIEDQINRSVKNEIETSLTRNINNEIERLMKEGKVKGEYSSDPDLTLEEWILKRFTKASGWGSPSELIEKLAKKFGDEMKQRYDLLFASQIVAKLNESGLLKEDVARLLLQAKP